MSNGSSPATVVGPAIEGLDRVFTPEALELLGELHRRFEPRRRELLHRRIERQDEVRRGQPLDFLDSTRAVREDDGWQVKPAPVGLTDRRSEITGPTEAKMAVNALNSGAKVWLADLEDANTPHWHNVVDGQIVLQQVSRGTLEHVADDGRVYRLDEHAPLAVAVPRPRGWHLDERHVTVDGEPMSGSILDAALYLLHNARTLLEHDRGPYLYLAKLESHLEARLWAEVLAAVEEALGIDVGTVRVTVLIETVPAAFEMDEILYELRDHITGLNAGRWDYLFSLIKVFRASGPSMVLPDRSQVTMDVPFMRAYTELLVRTCHRRGAHAIGGMSAFIPNRRDPEVTDRALAKVRADKQREADDGFDGSWVAHPDLVGICTEVFTDAFGDRTDQLDRLREDVEVTGDQLLDVASAEGTVTREGVRANVAVGVEYLAAWLGGRGAVAIANLMEDAATAEISRAQLWQWVHNEVRLTDGSTVTAASVREVLTEEVTRLVGLSPDAATADRVREAAELFEVVALDEVFVDFLTLPAYDRIVQLD
jgi:malate synthase